MKNQEKNLNLLKRQSLLIKLNEDLRETFDLDKGLSIICEKLTEIFDVNRAAIAIFPDPDDYSKMEHAAEYTTTSEILSAKKRISKKTKNFLGKTIFEEKKDIVLDNIEESDYPEYFKKNYRTLNIKSMIGVPIRKKDQKWGILGIFQYETPRSWTKEDVKIMHLIAKQAYIAINQVELYQKAKQTAQREKTLRDLINIVRSTLDRNEAKKNLVHEIGKALDADRVFLTEFEPETNTPLVLDAYSEYLSSPDFISLVGYDFASSDIKFLAEIHKKKESVIVPDVDKFIEENNLYGTPVEKWIKQMELKSGIGIPTCYGEKVYGVLSIHYIKRKNPFTEEDIEFLQAISDQVGIALYQVKLYENVTKEAEKEKILRELTTTMSDIFDIDQIKRTIVTKIGELYNADRCFIRLFDFEKKQFLPITESEEYLSSYETRSIIGLPAKAICSTLIRTLPLITPVIKFYDIEKLLNSPNEDIRKAVELFLTFNIKSYYSVAIHHAGILIGRIVLAYSKEKYKLLQGDLDFLNAIAVQMGITIYQARLFETVRKTVERERALRDVFEALSASLDVKEIKSIIADQVAKILKPYRLIVGVYDPKEEILPFEPFTEYRRSPDVKSFLEETDISKFRPFIEHMQAGGEIHCRSIEQLLRDLNLPDDCVGGKGLREYNVQSGMGLPLIYADKFFGSLDIHFDKPNAYSEEDFDFMRILANQAALVIHQAKLYEQIKQKAEREALLSKLITTIRSSLDYNQTKRILVDEIGKALNADRVLLASFDLETNTPLPLDEYSEYLPDPNMMSLVGYDLTGPAVEILVQTHKQRKPAIVPDLDKFIEENDLYGTAFEKWRKDVEVETGIGLTIFYGEKVYGALTVNYRKKRPLTDEDVEFLQTIANQTGIALHQASLYEQIKQVAERERLLREILTDIKISQSIEEVYNYIIKKIADTFNLNRCFFIEMPSDIYEKPFIKYEYIKNAKQKPLKYKTKNLPKDLLNVFEGMGKTLKPFYINNTKEFHRLDKSYQDFFEEFKIGSLLAMPLVRYNRETKLLGIITLCISEFKVWNQLEINFLQSIVESVVNVVWDISKRAEIEELRSTFMLTLAHDLQVPLVGEHKALEFLSTRPSSKPIGDFKEIIAGLMSSNEELSAMLMKLLDSYNYESGRQVLKYNFYDMADAINDVVEQLRGLADSKSILLQIEIQKDLPKIKFDIKEIQKVIFNILENALLYIQENCVVIISCKKVRNSIETCIIDNGPGIPPEVISRLFERYVMAQTIERKVGSGLGLYLSKQIVDTHGGKFYYETELGKGSTFCFILPISQKEQKNRTNIPE